MAKLLSRVIVLVLIIVFSLTLYECAYLHNAPAADVYSLKYEEVFNSKKPLDILIIGSSKAADALNPKVFEDNGKYNTYNFAFPGANPLFTMNWYTELFTKYHSSKPKLIVYCVDWFMFDDVWMSRKLDHDIPYYPFKIWISQLFNLDNDLQILIKERLALLKDNNRLSVIMCEPKSTYSIEKFYKGYVPYDDGTYSGSKSTRKAKIKSDQLQAFDCFLQHIKKENIEIILVQLPELIDGREGKNMKEVNLLISSIAKKKGVKFLNYNEDLKSKFNYDVANYKDWSHMNQSGGDKFTALLNDKFKSIRLIK